MASCSIHLSLLLTFYEFLPLVVGVAAFRKGDLDLCDAANEVDLERDDRETLLVDLAGETVDLPPVE